MNEQTWINPKCNREGWGAGEWDAEPDKVQWTDTATGLVCLARRNERYGNWCGYVGVPQGHPLHNKGYDDAAVEVHGGLTYAGECGPGEPYESICHVSEAGQPEHLYWFGFDCHHAWDFAPGMAALLRRVGSQPWPLDPDDVYRPLTYVKEQCTELAKQLAAVQP